MSLIEHLEKLRHFYRLTSYRSIKNGALGMGLSQAGLSKSISSLESVLDTQLFTRSNDGLVLTKEGELVSSAAKRILDEANKVEINLRSLKAAKVPAKFKIGMYDSIAIYFYPNLSAYLKEIYPEVELELVVDRSSNLSSLVYRNKVDLAIGVNFKGDSDNEVFHLFEDYYSFYCSPKIDHLANLPYIFHPDAADKDGKTNLRYLSRFLEKKLAHHVYNIETIKGATVSGMGIGVLPTQVAKPLISQKLLIQIKIPKVQNIFGNHVIGFLTSKNIMKHHPEFVRDIYRLGKQWSKT